VSDTAQAVLDALHPTQAFLLGRQLNALAWNAAWHDFVEPLGIGDAEARGAEGEVDLAHYLFGHPAARTWWAGWPTAVDMATSMLRTARSQWADDPQLAATIEALHRYPEFTCRWREHRMTDFRSATVRLNHPVRGEVEVEIETLNPAMDQNMMVWLVDRRRAHTPGLRLVNE
jgi:hypothetical protein